MSFNVKKMIEIRKRKRMSQKLLAELSGISVATIKGYEQGKFLPRPETEQRIARALGVYLTDLDDELVVNYSLTQLDFEKELLESGSEPNLSNPYGREAAVSVFFKNLNEEGQKLAVNCIKLLQDTPSLSSNFKKEFDKNDN